MNYDWNRAIEAYYCLTEAQIMWLRKMISSDKKEQGRTPLGVTYNRVFRRR